jgi:hypothetical protein
MQPTLEQPVTEEGRWELDPGGAWILVEPSAEWLAERDAAPDPEPVTVDPVALLVSALRDPLANLTASSASTTVRTAILNQRAALDALLAVLAGG